MKGLEPDVIVIGSGAGGGASAWALSSAGLRVLVIEAGPAYDPAKDYPLDRPDWEQQGFPGRALHKGRYTFGPMQDIREDGLRSWNKITGPTNQGTKRGVYGYHHMRGVGGTTLTFSAEAHRLNPDSMKLRSITGAGQDWPIEYGELEPYYLTAERETGVAGPPGDKVRWRSGPYPLPPHRLSYASTKLAAGCEKLGMKLVQNSVAILSRPYDGRPACNYCANCARGCPRTDKGSTDVTFMRKALASGNCTIVTEAVVTRIKAGEGDRVTGVEYVDKNGGMNFVKASAVVAACGAIETPRLMLISSCNHAPDGLLNETGQVGRNFMETVSWTSIALHPEPLGSHRGIPSDSIAWEYSTPDAIEGVPGGARFSSSTPETGLVGPIGYARRVVEGWGEGHKKRMRETFGRVLSAGSIAECLPNKKAFVQLDPARKDGLGLPIARINSHLAQADIMRLRFMAGKCREILEASGAGELIEEYGTYDTFSSTHVFGTCRMGEDPERSAVDRFCRGHRMRNLFVSDSSVFPSTGGGEAPSLTIEALALRTAGHIAALFKKGEL